jgi:hypothetical protein
VKEEMNPKTYFWPYDLFGYLLPGFVVEFCLIEFNSHIRSLFTARFQSKDPLDIAALIGIAYVSGHLVAALSSLLLENIILKKTVGYPSYQLFDERKSARWKILKLIPGYTSSYSKPFCERTKRLFEAVFGYEPEMPPKESHPGELYWIVSCYVSENHPSGYRSATHFLELYGFSRNTSMSFFIIAWFSFLSGWNLKKPSAVWIPFHIPLECIWFIGMNLIGLVMYYNYTKLFRRQNDQLFRSFVVAANEKVMEAESTNPPRLILPSEKLGK